jgi:hypothetical protein
LKVIIESDNGADQLNYASLVHATFEYDSIWTIPWFNCIVDLDLKFQMRSDVYELLSW